MHLSWSSIVSAGVFVAVNPWSSTLFRAIGCWLARISPRDLSRPLALLLAFSLLAGTIPVQAQYQRRAARSGVGAPSQDVLAGAVARFQGKLRSVDKKQIVIAAADDQIVTFHRSRKTKFLAGSKEVKPQDIPYEALVTVEASKDSVGDLVAVDIIWKKS